MPAISIIMPCHNRANDLLNALRAYDNQVAGERFEIIAVDDGSNDETYQVLKNFRPERFRLKVERLEENQGPAVARNRGISAVEGPIVLFVGDDIVPDQHLVSGHLAAHRHHPQKEVAILGRTAWPEDLPTNTLMAHIDGVGAQQFSYYYLKDGQEYDFRHFYTSNISLKRDLLLSLDKWFDTQFQFAAFEDAELAYRLAKRGMRIVYASHISGYHYHYHNIWTFSQRQYRSGLMACLLARKHPELTRLVMGKGWKLRALHWRLRAVFRQYPPGLADSIERKALQLLNDYEWTRHQQLDGAYFGVLKYYYYKGLIYGTFGTSELSRRIHAVLAYRVLRPLIRSLN